MILGINALFHNSGVAFYDGEPRLVVEEERFNRRKKSRAIPAGCLEAGAALGLSSDEVEAVAFPWSPRRLVPTIGRLFVQTFPHSLAILRARKHSNTAVVALTTLHEARRAREQIAKQIGAGPPQHAVDHHLAHAAGAFFCSPHEHAIVLVVDGFGDQCSASAYLGRGLSLKRVYANSLLNSLGFLYSIVTAHLGFRMLFDEGKVMALASMGSERFVDDFRRIIRTHDDGSFDFDFSYLNYRRDAGRPFTDKFTSLFGRARVTGQPLEQCHMDLARALQVTLEEALLNLLRGLRQRFGVPNLCFSGGVALNCLANGRIAREAGFDNVFVPPNADDSGTPLGAAMYLHHCVHGRERCGPIETAAYGTEYTTAEVKAALRGLEYQARIDDPAEAAAALIEHGRTVGWFQGRMETGPRALGNRSILADPRRDWMQDHLNKTVKHRESFRPFAPSVLVEHVADWLPDAPPSPFMSFAGHVAPDLRAQVPAIIHVDGSARLQTVDRDTQPLYHKLIAAFANRTGVPMVLNTSLNDREPICATPEHAVACFKRSGLEALVIGNLVAVKDTQDLALAVAGSDAAGVRSAGAVNPA